MMRRMSPPDDWSEVVGGKRYTVGKATLIASDDYWDGSNFDRRGRNTFLYRTPTGRYFCANMTMWQGEMDTLTPIGEEEARELYENLREKEVPYEAAFPNFVVEEA